MINVVFATSAAWARVTSAAKLLDKSPVLAALEPSSVVILVSNTLPTSAADAVAAFPPIFKLVTGVADITVNGAVPVATLELNTFAVAFPVTFIVPSTLVLPVDTVPNVVVPVTSNVPVPVIFVAVIFATVVLPDTVKFVPTVESPDVVIVVKLPVSGLFSPILPSTFPSKFAFIVPTSPENTLPSSNASGI